jgi:aspartyl-tRNA(Asn)/glutamyl-tRNA(Gln) amidotransferase subunit A
MAAHGESDLAFLSISQAARLLRRREISPVELVGAALERIARWSPKLDAFLTVIEKRAREQAEQAERELRRGKWRGPLHGIPVSLKDNFWTRGIRTTAGSKILAEFVPKADSEVAKSLAQAGAILLGKTNMHEFAYGITGENPHYGSSRNPWAPERISGGSSGGSAVAVATGMNFGSFGTDTGGSIRIPAALCGIVGFKPTYGLVSVEGVVPLGVSFDHVGPLARDVTDACILLEAVAGKYPSGEARPNYRTLRKNLRRRFRLGWPRDFFFERVNPEIQSAIEAAAKKFEKLGARIEEIALPGLADSVDRATNLVVAEASYYHESQGYFPSRSEDYGDDVRGHLQWGHNLRAVDYLRAIESRDEVNKIFVAAMDKVDADSSPSDRREANARFRRARNGRARGAAALHTALQHHRAPGDFNSLRIHERRLADWIAADRPSQGRGAAALDRARVRARHRLAHPPSQSGLKFGLDCLRFSGPRPRTSSTRYPPRVPQCRRPGRRERPRRSDSGRTPWRCTC